jgi:hypothetical protein
MRRISAIALALFALACNCFAQERLLDRVPQLQETARRANGGELGCGVGFFTLITSRGEVKASGGLDPVQVFGRTIKVADLLPLLEARAAFNHSGAANPMSGQVTDLTFVVLYTLARAKDPDSISVIAELLKDREDGIRGWAAIALYDIAKSDEGLKAKIQKIEFPESAVVSARGRGNPPPDWVRIAPDI